MGPQSRHSEEKETETEELDSGHEHAAEKGNRREPRDDDRGLLVLCRTRIPVGEWEERVQKSVEVDSQRRGCRETQNESEESAGRVRSSETLIQDHEERNVEKRGDIADPTGRQHGRFRLGGTLEKGLDAGHDGRRNRQRNDES